MCVYVCACKGMLLNNYIPRVRVGYELALIIPYATSATGIIGFLKTPTKYCRDGKMRRIFVARKLILKPLGLIT